jgi:hypothetical protein
VSTYVIDEHDGDGYPIRNTETGEIEWRARSYRDATTLACDLNEEARKKKNATRCCDCGEKLDRLMAAFEHCLAWIKADVLPGLYADQQEALERKIRETHAILRGDGK